MTLSIKNLKVWDDLFDPSLDEQLAPEIDQVVEQRAHKIYSDPLEFFKRTYFSESIINAVKHVLRGLRGEGKNVITLYSLFGGGKTHTLITLYHAFKSPESLGAPDVLKGNLDSVQKELLTTKENIEKLGSIDIVIVYGKNYGFSGRPAKPLDFGAYSVHTLWGLMAHSLGRYDLMKVDDQNLTTPDVETIRKVIEGKSVLILMDEILDYIYTLQNSLDSREKNYAKNIPSFLDRLATALVGTKSVLVFTMPIEVSFEGNLKGFERRYDRHLVESLLEVMKKALNRVGASPIAPLKRTTEKNDVVAVLKKRVFEEIPADYVKSVVDEYRLNFETFRESIGDYQPFLNKLREYAPYHPEYVGILEDVIERAGLQKTRDILKFSRNTVREILQKEEDTLLVMPWHIDILENESIRAGFFSGDLGIYASVAKRDIGENCSRLSNPDLARKIVSYIFLKTFYFDNPLPQPGFPGKTDIIKGIFEPATFSKKKWTIPDIADILDEIDSTPNLVFINQKDGVYWYWKRANVNEQIESARKRFLNENRKEVEKKLKEYVKSAVFGERMFGTRRRGRNIPPPQVKSIFKKDSLYVVSDPAEYPIRDDDRYKLVVIVRDEASRELLKDTILKIREGDRRYKNTVVAVSPANPNDYERCLYHTAGILACEEVTSRVKELYAGLSKEAIAIQEGVVKRVREGTERELQDQIIATFRKVAFPAGSDVGDFDIKEKVSSESVSTILDHVHSVLSSPGIGKLQDNYSFTVLGRDVKTNMGISLSEGQRELKISEIRDWYKTNPKFPMVEEETIKKALEEGVKQLQIGIEGDGQVWYKKVYENTVPEGEDLGAPPSTMRSDYFVLPWRIAIKKQVDNLLNQEEEWVEGDLKKAIKFFVIANGEEFSLREVHASESEGWLELVKEGKILKKFIVKGIEKGDFEINFIPSLVSASPGESVRVKIEIKPVKTEDRFRVRLSPEIGTLELTEGEVPFTTVWNLVIGESMKSAILKAESDWKKKEVILKIKVKSEVIEISEIKEEHIGHHLLGIKGISRYEDFRQIADLLKSNGFFEGFLQVKAENAGFKANFENLPADISQVVGQEVKELIPGEFSLFVDATVKEPIEINEVIFHKLKTLANVNFILKKPNEHE